MEPLYIRQYEDKDGSTVQMRWGYCREQNAVRLGYCVNILAALIGLILVWHLSAIGLWVCSLVGGSFGCGYFAEQIKPSPLRNFVMLGSIACAAGAYIPILALAIGG